MIEDEIAEVDVLVEDCVLEGGSLVEGEMLFAVLVGVAEEVYFLELCVSEARFAEKA